MSTWLPDRQHWQRWGPDLAAGFAVLVLGIAETNRDLSPTSTWGPLLVVVGLATAVGAHPTRARGAPWSWPGVSGGVHLLTGTGPLVTEVLLAYVAFGCARWGHRTVVWLSGLSIPSGATIAVLWLEPYRLLRRTQRRRGSTCWPARRTTAATAGGYRRGCSAPRS